MTYLAHEMDVATCEPTGRVLHYSAETIDEAVASVLYTARLKNGKANVGPTGRVVYAGPTAFTVIKQKEKLHV